MTFFFLLRPQIASDGAVTPTPSTPLGPGPIGGIDGSNLVPLKPVKKVTAEEIRHKLIDEDVDEKVIENITELFDIAPEALAALSENTIVEISYDQEAQDLLDLMRRLEDLILERQEQLLAYQRAQASDYIKKAAERQAAQLATELLRLQKRIEEREDEELLLLLIHQLH